MFASRTKTLRTTSKIMSEVLRALPRRNELPVPPLTEYLLPVEYSLKIMKIILPHDSNDGK